MTPAEVRALREAHRFRAGDLYGVSGLRDIIDRQAATPIIAEQCFEIRSLLERLPDFAEAGGYAWSCDPESYDLPADAAFQRRALLMLAKH